MNNSKIKQPTYIAQEILSRRDHSEAEMRAKLEKKELSQEDIEKTIKWLYKHKLLNDENFAQVYTDSIMRSRQVGPKWIIHKLRGRGIAEHIAEQTVTDAMACGTEEEIIKKATEEWKRIHPQYKDDKQRLTRFLLSRGFSMGKIIG